ncbi:hypothetical protein C8F04DRAFT_486244 [Mycena alexandri]|uniref:Uncharacterized protein n=1 Tax=Mycena alexandri TaxID=1745969 RepID=A0AAD6WQB1_9AGAR|nr:hypothetical protein C8F04DRAFT_486244 [Mycena alexandri]
MESSQPEVAHGNYAPSNQKRPQPHCISLLSAAVWAGWRPAFCLGRAGHEVTVLESAPRISEVGAGIQVSGRGSPPRNRVFISSKVDLDQSEFESPPHQI